MGYNQRKKSKKLKEQWESIKIQQDGCIVKPGQGSRCGNNKQKVLTRRMKKALREMQREDGELLALQALKQEKKRPATKEEMLNSKPKSSEVIPLPEEASVGTEASVPTESAAQEPEVHPVEAMEV